MSRAFKSQIWVVQAGQPIVKVGDGEEKGGPLMISYHRRMYGLGEVSERERQGALKAGKRLELTDLLLTLAALQFSAPAKEVEAS